MNRVLIATNEPILAKGLETILIAGGLQVVAVCRDIFEVFEQLQSCWPDIAVLDIPILTAPDVIQDLRRVVPQCQFVLWPRLGPDDPPERLVEAMSIVARYSAPNSSSAFVSNACSESERALISLVGYGLTDEEIAAVMGCDRLTVRKAVSALSDRLGLEDRFELALFGLSALKEPPRHDDWSL